MPFFHFRTTLQHKCIGQFEGHANYAYAQCYCERCYDILWFGTGRSACASGKVIHRADVASWCLLAACMSLQHVHTDVSEYYLLSWLFCDLYLFGNRS